MCVCAFVHGIFSRAKERERDRERERCNANILMYVYDASRLALCASYWCLRGTRSISNALVVTITAGVVVSVNRVTVSTGSRCHQGHGVNKVRVSTGSGCQQGHSVNRVRVSTGSQCQQGDGVWFAGSRDYQAGPVLPTEVWCSISRRRH